MHYNTHHISKRKRISQKLESYPSKNFWIRFLDKFLIIIAVIAPLTTIPQIITLYTLRQAAGLSIYSWSAWTILDIPWIIYGIVHKEKPITIAYILWFLMNLSVVIGILLFSK